MSKTVICLAKTEAQAGTIVQRLNDAGAPTRDISVLFPDTTGSRDFAHEHHTKAPEGTAIGASAGGVTGGALGLLAGIGALAIPGAGPFIAAGPIMAALSGAAVGATIGGIAGALIGWVFLKLKPSNTRRKSRKATSSSRCTPMMVRLPTGSKTS